MVILIGLGILNAALLIAVWFTDFFFQRSLRAAVHRLELQVAFLAGRIGVRGEQIAAAAAEEGPIGPTEVLGGIQWNDTEDRLTMAEQAQATEVPGDGDGNR